MLTYILIQYTTVSIFIAKTTIFRHLFRSGRIFLKFGRIFWGASYRKVVEGSGNRGILVKKNNNNSSQSAWKNLLFSNRFI
jgi:hypothetical protein